MKSTARLMIATFGGFSGLMGIEHGIGEIMQGSKAPEGLMILSWPGSRFFDILNGEPAMTVIPNLLITGILAVIVSLAYFIVAVWFVDRKHGSLALIGLAPLMLLVGGGIFPPVLGLLIGVAAAWMQVGPAKWPARLPATLRKTLAAAWPWFFGACLAAWLGMFPGVPVMNYFFGLHNEAIILSLLAGMFLFLFLSMLTSSAT